MRIQGIAAVRRQGSGKIDIEATKTAWIKREHEKFAENYKAFEEAFAAKLAGGGKDQEDLIADALVSFFSKFSEAKNSATLPRAQVVGLVAPKLIEAHPTIFKMAEFKEVCVRVEDFIYDNSVVKEKDSDAWKTSDAWFVITTGKGRGAGLVTEYKRPEPEDLTVATDEDENPNPETVNAETAETPENADPLANVEQDPEMVAQLAAAAEALA